MSALLHSCGGDRNLAQRPRWDRSKSGYSLAEIGDHLDIEIGAVETTLHPCRAGLKAAPPADRAAPRPPSAALQRHADLFNARDWEGLKGLLADEVHLGQAARAEQRGRDVVAATFFAGYAGLEDWRLEPGQLGDRHRGVLTRVVRSASPCRGARLARSGGHDNPGLPLHTLDPRRGDSPDNGLSARYPIRRAGRP